MPNAQRQRNIASLLTRHARVVGPTGTVYGCLCGHPAGRLDHTKHLADLIDRLVESAVDAVFGDHGRASA